jgi:hypothetical protein
MLTLTETKIRNQRTEREMAKAKRAYLQSVNLPTNKMDERIDRLNANITELEILKKEEDVANNPL